MIAAADTGPLTTLGKVGLLRILPRLYSRVLVAEAVRQEAVFHRTSTSRPDILAVEEAVRIGWIHLAGAAPPAADLLTAGLGPGETEALSLVLARRAAVLLSDDLDARTWAKSRGLAVRGTVGLIRDAARREVLGRNEALTALQELSRRPRIWISRELLREAISELEAGGPQP